MNLIYLDANNLYEWAMSQPLSTDGFRFLQLDEIEALAVGELSDDAEDGYIFEVDLSYPQHLYNAHDNYPLAPESLEIVRDMYLPAQQAVFSQTTSQRKLNPNLREKSQVCGTLPQPEAIPPIGSCSYPNTQGVGV